VTQAPKAPANPWLANVATKIPAMMGQGLRKRSANTKANSWVLSPISAKATMPVEIQKACITPMVAVTPDAGLHPIGPKIALFWCVSRKSSKNAPIKSIYI
jgi:hypothetical protein